MVLILDDSQTVVILSQQNHTIQCLKDTESKFLAHRTLFVEVGPPQKLSAPIFPILQLLTNGSPSGMTFDSRRFQNPGITKIGLTQPSNLPPNFDSKKCVFAFYDN